MNKSLRYIALLAIIPLFTAGLTTNYFTDAEAIKSQGSNAPGRLGTSSYGSANNSIVCGDRLCSEIPGGRAAFEEQQRMPTPVEPVTDEEMILKEKKRLVVGEESVSILKVLYVLSIILV